MPTHTHTHPPAHPHTHTHSPPHSTKSHHTHTHTHAHHTHTRTLNTHTDTHTHTHTHTLTHTHSCTRPTLLTHAPYKWARSRFDAPPPQEKKKGALTHTPVHAIRPSRRQSLPCPLSAGTRPAGSVCGHVTRVAPCPRSTSALRERWGAS